MPAANTRALEKAKTIPADALIFDLEDAVAPGAKAQARGNAVEAAASGAYGGRELTIRCNGLDTPWGADDLAAAAGAAPAGVVIPKVSGVAQLAAVVEALDAAGAPGSVRIWAMVETPTGVFEARSIAGFERVAVLVMGTNDLAAELRAKPGPDRTELLGYLATALAAAREAGKAILDGVFNDISDADGFAAECRQGAAMGFDGKTLIHPNQVEVANTTWAPSADEIAEAHRVVAAFAEAEAAGRGVVTVDGRMIENLHVEAARRTLSLQQSLVAAERLQ